MTGLCFLYSIIPRGQMPGVDELERQATLNPAAQSPFVLSLYCLSEIIAKFASYGRRFIFEIRD